MILTREKIQRMIKGSTTVAGGSGSGSSGGGGGSAAYADEAGHAASADEATHATSADNAMNAAYATLADFAGIASKLDDNSSDWQKIARKDIAQTIAEVWTFAKGIVSSSGATSIVYSRSISISCVCCSSYLSIFRLTYSAVKIYSYSYNNINSSKYQAQQFY